MRRLGRGGTGLEQGRPTPQSLHVSGLCVELCPRVEGTISLGWALQILGSCAAMAAQRGLDAA